MGTKTIRWIFFLLALFLIAPTHIAYGKKERKQLKDIEVPAEDLTVSRTVFDLDVAVVVHNQALRDFKDRKYYPWCCSVIVNYDSVVAKGMPPKEEAEAVLKQIDHIDEVLKRNQEHPNALFTARITRKGQLQVFWQLYDAKIAQQYLDYVVSSNVLGHEMEYSISYDEDWDNVKLFVDTFDLYNDAVKNLFKEYFDEYVK